MIILETLKIQHFKALRSIDLRFPRRGSVLIEGWNESGKSSLFEAIVVALYGAPLIVEEQTGTGRKQSESVVTYGQSEATIRLGLDVDGTKLMIKRVLSSATTRAEMVIDYPGGKRDVVRGQTTVSSRILAELGHLSRDALLNSCFVEQKKLGKLEELKPEERRAALESLLNLTRLQGLQRQYKVTNEDRLAEALARRQLELAQMDARLPTLALAVQECEVALRLGRVQQWQGERVARQAQQASLLAEERTVAAERQQSNQQLARDATLRQARQAISEIRVQQRELDQVQVLLAQTTEYMDDLDREEQATLPDLEQQQGALDELRTLQARHTTLQVEWERRRADVSAWRVELKKGDVLHARVGELDSELGRERADLDATEAELRAQNRRQEEERAHLATLRQRLIMQEAAAVERQELMRWLEGDAGQARGDPFRAAHTQAEAEASKQEAAQEAAHQRVAAANQASAIRAGLAAGLVLLGVGLMAGRLFWGAGLLGVAAVLGWWARQALLVRRRAVEDAARAEAALRAAQHQLATVTGQEQAWQTLDGGARMKAEAEQRLRSHQRVIPTSRAEAEARLLTLGPGNAANPLLANAPTRLAIEEQINQLDQALLRYPAQLETLAARRVALRPQEAEHRDAMAWLSEHDLTDIARQVDDEDRRMAAIEADLAAAANAISAASQQWQLDPTPEAAHEAFGMVRRQVAEVRSHLDRRPEHLRDREHHLAASDRLSAIIADQWAALRRLIPEDMTAAPPHPAPMEVETLDQHLAQELGISEVNDPSSRRAALDRRLGEIQQQLAAQAEATAQLEAMMAADLAALPPGSTQPTAAPMTASHLAALEQAVEEAQVAREVASQQRTALATELGIPATTVLDLAVCAAEYEQMRHDLRVKERAGQIVDGVRDRMLAKVLPKTSENMSQILPLLTLDRYRDCLITDDYKLRIWDEEARRFVAKNIYSGGTRDQISLALRLAFALATLPEELGTTPGFIFLDEPLSSFDGPRSEAMVNLLTRGRIHEEFDQIFVISHSLAFDRQAFTHHLRLEYGAVVDSTLPTSNAVEQPALLV